ncbi:aminoacyl-tRNA hydrolase [Nanchangia anserum]|uniref:Peptidyl-tRNA hydrolase n=1 Tax=Nanchangia anserum TaxID=2692125 RepID=A0A8I0GDH1_9ACTO|nr:aminoacyl-tRNA hydrolase [Nanchangia anserum]MBD3689981.1 aminoacyl-tRNA hydrolase [Nanchangia anserum]QOX82216.1 aminoacyl-tRNA hydrolase [Nanchangia anserum]
MSDTWVIVGLGNPGAEYAGTRHNLGHDVIGVLADRMGVRLKRHRGIAHIGEGRVGIGASGGPGPRCVIATLQCFMNVSGGPTKQLLDYFHVDATARLLVVHDELDLEAHDIRLKRGGGEGGHNGLRSISQALGTRDYARLRLGIGRPPGRQDPADYVLGKIAPKQRADWEVTFERAADVCVDVVTSDFAAAQQRLHTA